MNNFSHLKKGCVSVLSQNLESVAGGESLFKNVDVLPAREQPQNTEKPGGSPEAGRRTWERWTVLEELLFIAETVKKCRSKRLACQPRNLDISKTNVKNRVEHDVAICRQTQTAD